ncbi:hypothetical protein [Sphingobium sp. B2]|uniref:hypothetical protein n=1 Tax=Sphingobium sp. B2 TaxID=2583228 RepID=UPI0021BD55A7|nr:hypothetical protein [Sphingobium sp. B2]
MKQLVGELRAEWHELDTKVEALNGEFVELARKMCIRDSLQTGRAIRFFAGRGTVTGGIEPPMTVPRRCRGGG